MDELHSQRFILHSVGESWLQITLVGRLNLREVFVIIILQARLRW